MVWFVIGILVLLAGGAAVLYVVLHATSGDDESAPFSPDASPTGDTSEHAGEQSGGETVAGADASDSGGTGTPHTGGGEGDVDPPGAEEKPPGTYESGVIGGEAEAEPTAEPGEPPTPAT